MAGGVTVHRAAIAPRPGGLGRLLAFLVLAVLTAWWATAVNARGPAPIGEVPLAELPAEARDTLELVKRGGPFPYRKDGSVFGNFEKRLPIRPRGYYREYTVKTPGARDRGARRIVAGAGSGGDVRTSGEYYYTADHYASFRRIRE